MTRPDSPRTPNGNPIPPRPPLRRRLLPLVLLAVAALIVGAALHRWAPGSVPPPVVPAYTPQQAASAKEHIDTLRDQFAPPAPSTAPTAPILPEAPSRAAPAAVPPPPIHLQISQADLNTYLATDPDVRAMLGRRGVRAVQITLQSPHGVVCRAAILYKGHPANVQITGDLFPSPRTAVRLVATQVQVDRLPVPPAAITQEADTLAAGFADKVRGRLSLSVRKVQVVGTSLVLTGIRARPPG